jgi:hypothetical protein
MPARKDWNQDREKLLHTYSSWLRDAQGLMADHTLARQLEDDRPIALRRKRRSSSSAFADASNAGQGSSTVNNHVDPISTTAIRTPKKPKKRVRFSDPGPNSNSHNQAATGLTPAVARTSLHNSASSSVPSQQQTPFRRHSTSAVASTEVIQFTPLTQQLTPRVKRRLRRNGLSEEMNYIEKDRNQAATRKGEEANNALKKQLEAKVEEIARLKEEVKAAKDPKLAAGSKLAELEEEHSLLRDQLHGNVDSEDPVQDDAMVANDDGDFEIIDHPMNDSASYALASSPTKKQQPCVTDASTEASLTSLTHEAEIFAISLEYEAQIEGAKREKRELFDRLRPHFPPSQFGLGSRESTPTPESLGRLADTLLTTKARADDADKALSALWTELKTFGFPGDRTEEIVNEMKQQFRQARLELERAVPGETVIGFEPAKVIPALLQHIQGLAVELHSRESEVRGMNDRHSALSGQFGITLGRLDNAARRIVDLEQTIDSGAEEMLAVRMTAQRLEKDIGEKDVGISRLIAASDKYRDDIKNLETLVKTLENGEEQQQKQFRARMEGMEEAVGDLECKVAAEEKGRRSAEVSSSQRGRRIEELESTVEQGRRYASEVEAHLEALKFEKEQVASSMQARLNLQEEKHESHLGALNVRISNLTTALASANAEVNKLKAIKETLEKRIREEVDEAQVAMEAMQERAIRSVARNNETKKSYLRKSKIRYANAEIDDDEGLEQRGPLTPDSAVRFKDYVEVGRGKHRRKYDSGIGILSEEEEGDDELATEPLSEGDFLPGDMVGMEVGEPSSPATR